MKPLDDFKNLLSPLSAAPTLPTAALHLLGYQRQTEPEADCLATTQMAFSMDINSPTTGLDHT